MFTTIVIFGGSPAKYASEGDFNKALNTIEDEGIIASVNFKTQAELDAYHKGLDDSNGWSEYYVVERDEINKLKLAAAVKGIKL